MKDITKELKKLATVPQEQAAFEEWLKMTDALQFLEDNARDEEFVVYAGADFTYLHAVLVPRAAVEPPNVEDLLGWNFNASSSWAVWSSLGDQPDVGLSAPLSDCHSKSFVGGEQLVFTRYFEGMIGNKSYFEILQKCVHLLGLHFMPERNAFCRLDNRGNIEEAIRFVESFGASNKVELSMVTFSRKLLEVYAALTDSAMVRTFDFTRFMPKNFAGWGKGKVTSVTAGDPLYRLHSEKSAAYMRGVQIIRPTISKPAASSYLFDGEPEEKRYETFLAYDWKNKKLEEISCAPGATANYFTKSDLPFEVTPAFFRPEVLRKYKDDSDKYTVDARSISCRGAWSLKTYDINEAGQVHTYLVYLRSLPFEEQQHWKAYNEAPKSPISKRAYTTDFLGQWASDEDPLEALKYKLREWSEKSVPWWVLRTTKALDVVHYPVTSAADEWSEELLHLDQLLVEGFEKPWLKQRALALGRTTENQWGTLKLIEECLIGAGFEEADAKSLMQPLQTLHHLRSKLKGHVSGGDAVKLKQAAVRDHGSYKAHFVELCRQCRASLEAIETALSGQK